MLHKGLKPEVIKALLESNFLNLVRDLLRNATSEKTKEYTWNVLAGILDDGDRAQYEMIANVNFLPSFLHETTLHFAQHNNLVLKLEAAIMLIKLWDSGIRLGFSANELTTRFEPYQVNRELIRSTASLSGQPRAYQVNRELINKARNLRVEGEQAIMIMKFARALGLNQSVSED